jgi:hypothetical protein
MANNVFCEMTVFLIGMQVLTLSLCFSIASGREHINNIVSDLKEKTEMRKT